MIITCGQTELVRCKLSDRKLRALTSCINTVITKDFDVLLRVGPCATSLRMPALVVNLAAELAQGTGRGTMVVARSRRGSDVVVRGSCASPGNGETYLRGTIGPWV
jgi:hypothetical protein